MHPEPSNSKRIRVLTWNINGLKPILRGRLNIGLAELLDSLHAGQRSPQCQCRFTLCSCDEDHAPLPCRIRDPCCASSADVVCFQETKLKKAELERELALVDGWCAPKELLRLWVHGKTILLLDVTRPVCALMAHTTGAGSPSSHSAPRRGAPTPAPQHSAARR